MNAVNCGRAHESFGSYARLAWLKKKQAGQNIPHDLGLARLCEEVPARVRCS